MALSDCALELSKAIGRTVTTAEAQRIMGAVDDRVKVREAERSFLSREEQLRAAGKELADEAQAAAMIEKRNRLLNLRKRIARTAFYESAPNVATGMEAKLDGVNVTGFKGSRDSVAAQAKALKRNYGGAMGFELQKAGHMATVRHGLLDNEWAAELFELSRGERGNPGVTKNRDALEIAKIVFKYQQLAVEGLNREGAWVGAYDGYISRTIHDADRIRNAAGRTASREESYKAWRDKILPRLDAARTFEGIEDPEQFLSSVYDALVTGVHLTHDGLTGFKDPAFKGPGNLAKRLSQGRSLHFRDAQAWMAYRADFGPRRAVIQDILASQERAAQSTALMRAFGTNPRAEFDADFARMEERLSLGGKRDQAAKLRDKRDSLNNLFAELDGTANMPANKLAASIGRRVRAAESISKLGAVLLASFGDLPTKAAAMRHHDIGLLQAYGNGLASIFRGRGRGEQRAVANELIAGAEGMLGNMMSRFDLGGDTPAGTMTSWVNTFFKFSGLTYWTDFQKAGMETGLSYRLGQDRNTAWAKLHPDVQRELVSYGVGEREWALLKEAEWTQADGKAYLTPQAATRLSDAAVDAHLVDQVAGIKARPGELRIQAAEKAAKEETWVQNRLEKYTAKKDRAVERLALLHEARGERFGKNIEAIQARIDLLGARIAGAEAETDLLGALRGMSDQDQMRRFLQQAHDRTAGAFKIAGKSDRAVERNARRNLTAGEKLGERRAKGEQRIKDLEKRARDLEAALVEKGDTETAGLMETLKSREDEIAAFIERVQERQQQRVEAAGRAESMVEPRLQKLRDDFRRDLALKLNAYFADNADRGIITPGPRENAILRQGTRPGSGKGELLRFIAQFKSFPVAMITKGWGRELNAGQGRMAAVAGVIHLAVATTIAGYLISALRDISKGRTPRDPRDPATWGAAMLAGGGLTLFGDLLLGDMNRFGGGMVETLAGPGIGTLAEMGRLFGLGRDTAYEAATGGTVKGDFASQGFRFLINHTPFVNMFYSRMALDYLFLYQIQEALSPGYLQRMESRIKQQNNQEFFFPPSKTMPRGGGSRPLEGVLG